MADQKISELTALTGANVADDDAIAIVDTSATETKKIVFSELKNALDTATGFVRITGDTMTGALDVQSTITSDGLTVDGTATFTTADNSAQVTLISTDTDALVGPQLNLWRNSGTGTNGDLIGQITFTGEDTVGSTNTFASIYSVADQTNNGSEDGSIHFQTLINGVLADRLEINSAGNTVVTGTLTSDGLTVDGDVALSEASPTISFTDTTDSSQHLVQSINSTFNIQGQSFVRLTTASTKRFDIDNGGDISFYEDTGTTAKFVWKSADERLGIGTSSPSAELHISGNSSDVDGIHYIAENTRVAGGPSGIVMKSLHGDWKMINSQTVADALEFIDGSAGATRMMIDSSGNVGIGTSSPSAMLNLKDWVGDGPVIRLEGAGQNSANTLLGALEFYNADNSADGPNVTGAIRHYSAESLGQGGYTTFHTHDGTEGGEGSDAPERMRIDSSGNAHIGGTTSVTTAVTGDNVAPKLIVEGTTATSIAVLRQDTSIVSGNSLGSLGFYGTDTTSNTPTPLAAVQALASGTHAAGDNPTDLRFFTTPDGSSTMAEAMRLDSSGHAIIPAGVTLGTSAGTYAAANTLDDYEEGTWTVTADFSTTSPSSGATTGTGVYTKIGNSVTVWGQCSNINVTGAVGNIKITGLPFASKSNATLALYAGTVRMSRVNIANSYCVAEVRDGENYIRLIEMIDDTNAAELTTADFTHGASDIFFTLSYQTT